jgi:hydroxyacylglutathione hydrolase
VLEQITFPVGPLACNCTVLGDDRAKAAIVIDPGAEVDEIERLLRARGWKLEAILITHAHIDHIGGAEALRQATGAPVWMHPRDAPLAATLGMQAQWIGVPPPPPPRVEGELIQAAHLALGSHAVTVLETPGHTPGSVCLYVPDEGKLFAGDTLFAGSIGRTDLPGGDTEAILRSLHGVVLALPDATRVIPGHGPETTIGRERHTNRFLRF